MTTDTQAKPAEKPSKVSSPRRLLILALTVGAVIEILLDPTLRNEEQPGLGFGVAAVPIGLVAGSGLLSPGLPSSRQIRIASIVLAFFGAMVFLRASPVLAVFNALVVFGLLLLIAHTYAGKPLAWFSIFDYLQAAFGGMGSALGGEARS